MVARALTPAEVVTAALPDLYAQARAGRDPITLYSPRGEPSPTWGDLAAALAGTGFEIVSWVEHRDKAFGMLRYSGKFSQNEV